MQNKINKQILHIAIPSVISNLTIPLLALTDTTIAGHISTQCLGAIAVSGTLFGILYNAFNFLRMGTGGFTSQAYGCENKVEVFKILSRSLSLAIIIGALLLFTAYPLSALIFDFIGASKQVTHYAQLYFNILIFGAPAVLSTYVFTGWFLGTQDAQTPMFVSIIQNIVNIVVSLFCVWCLHLHIIGLAIGTLTAQYCGLLIYIIVWIRKHLSMFSFLHFKASLNERKGKFLKVNFHIFLRTLCITAIQTLFTSIGAKHGDNILAANALLLQFFIIQSYFMDGLAYAGEAIGGKYYGQNNRHDFISLLKKLSIWGLIVMIFFVALYGFIGSNLLSLFTDKTNVIETATTYLPYVVILPLCGGIAFLLDGIFIGCTATMQMLWSMLVASIIFVIMIILLVPHLDNHGLWISFLLFLATRGIVELFFLKDITPKRKKIVPSHSSTIK